METANRIGFVAGALTTIAFLPQLQRTWRTKSADDMSLAMLLAFTTGVFLWLIYGLYLTAWPIS
jgi:MtN3 and saliva related transmembrane protein